MCVLYILYVIQAYKDLKVSGNGFTPFSLPGQFAPRSESANRTLTNSLPGTFAPWPIRSLALSLPGPSLPGPISPWPSRYSINRIIFADLAYSQYRSMTWR